MAATILLGVVVIGCTPSTVTPPVAPASGTPSAAPSSPASIAPPGSPDAPSASATGVAVDASLLGHLPTAVAGIDLEPDAETAAEIAGDPGVGASIDGIAVSTAFGPIASGAPTDYAVATVVHLRPGVFDDGWFRDWRDTFDAGVCAQAGGATGHAEASIGGHETFIGTCAGGVHTWHVHLAGPDVVVSIQGTGDGRFGEHIVEGLTE